MPPKNSNIVTLDDVRKRQYDDGDATNAATAAAAASLPAEYPKTNNGYDIQDYCKPIGEGHIPNKIPLYEIPNLAQSNACRNMLNRVHDEFLPIIRRRGYSVTSISELCCCGDGLDFVRRGKCRKMNNNVWGYNQTTTLRRGGTVKTSHTIHLRLRQPNSNNHQHEFFSYQDVAGTMAHELSHCVHQNHNQAFYKLTEEILEEHAVLQAQKFSGGNNYPVAAAAAAATTTTTTHTEAIPNITTNGQRLGGNSAPNKSRLLDGNRLGGRPRHCRNHRELAARAAEARKHQMEQIRRMIERSKEPCVIEIFDNDDDDDDDDDEKVCAVPKTNSNQVVEIIDNDSPVTTKNKVVNIVDNEVVEIVAPTVPDRKRARISQRKNHQIRDGERKQAQPQTPSVIDLTSIDSPKSWSCGLCTYQNRPTTSMCEMCHGPR